MYIKRALMFVFFSMFFVSCPWKMKNDFIFDVWTKEENNTVSRYLAKIDDLDFSIKELYSSTAIIPTLEIRGENVRFYLSYAHRVRTNLDSALRYCGELTDGYSRDFPVAIKYYDSDGKVVDSETLDFNLSTDFYEKIKSCSKIAFSVKDIELKVFREDSFKKVSFEFCVPLDFLNI